MICCFFMVLLRTQFVLVFSSFAGIVSTCIVYTHINFSWVSHTLHFIYFNNLFMDLVSSKAAQSKRQSDVDTNEAARLARKSHWSSAENCHSYDSFGCSYSRKLSRFNISMIFIFIFRRKHRELGSRKAQTLPNTNTAVIATTIRSGVSCCCSH